MVLNAILNVLGNADVSKLDNSTINCFIDFNNLTKLEQIKLLDELLHNLKFYKQIHDERNNQQTCEKEGHIYGEWYESISFKCYKGSSFKNKIWCKKCARCKNIEMTFVKPKELLKKEEEEKIESEIDDLQKRLIKLRKEK